MKGLKGLTLVEVVFIIILFVTATWLWNAYKFMSCDLSPDYKCEVVHGIGIVIPPLSVVTAWAEDDGA